MARASRSAGRAIFFRSSRINDLKRMASVAVLSRHKQFQFDAVSAAPVLAVGFSLVTRIILVTAVDWRCTPVTPLLWRVVTGHSVHQLVTLVAGDPFLDFLFRLSAHQTDAILGLRVGAATLLAWRNKLLWLFADARFYCWLLPCQELQTKQVFTFVV